MSAPRFAEPYIQKPHTNDYHALPQTTVLEAEASEILKPHPRKTFVAGRCVCLWVPLDGGW